MPELTFDSNGLIPCIVQDADTGAVLTLAYMNEESFAKTQETGETWFFSRSRNKLWHKGEESGNIQKVRELRYDCDEDAILALVDPTGPACHTGEITCFYRCFEGEPRHAAFEAPGELTTHARTRVAPTMPEGSYTTRAAERPAVHRREGLEEAEEVTRAAREETDDRVANEAADVIYHLAVLMTQRGLSPAGRVRRFSTSARADGSTAAGRSKRSAPSRASGATVIPLSDSFIEDSETPISAFLKLRGDGPAFLLESAEQGNRFGRWSFIGVKPRALVTAEGRRADRRRRRDRVQRPVSRGR